MSKERTSAESQTTEWKESWRNDNLKTLCAFANTDGGKMIIGKDDRGKVIGVRNQKDLLAEIPNTVYNVLGFSPEVRELIEEGKTIIEIVVKPQNEAISFNGSFYIRSGSTSVSLKGSQLQHFLLRKWGISWANLPETKIKMEQLSQEAINFFVKKGTEVGRMSPEAAKCDTESLLKNYELMDKDGLLKSGALLFKDRPYTISNGASVRIGAFTEGGRLLRHDLVECPVILQPDRVMDVIKDKYIQGTDEVDWLMRIRKYPYPMRALREAVLNGIIHKDYSSVVETTVCVFPNHVEIANPGNLPQGWTGENMLTRHASRPPNKNIARVFYEMGYIERFGSGIKMMSDECKAMGLPLPEYEIFDDIVRVIFRLPGKKNELIPENKAVDASFLTPTEQLIYGIISEGAAITREEIALMADVSLTTVKRTIIKLVETGYIKRIGEDKNGRWVSIKK